MFRNVKKKTTKIRSILEHFEFCLPKSKITVSQRIFILEAKFEMFQDALEISYHLSYLSH